MMKNGANSGISVHTVERLVVYRRLLQTLAAQGVQNVYSHSIAELANNTAAQVRRDVMAIGSMGSPSKGYDVDELISAINGLFTTKRKQNVALAGIGNLGQAILTHIGQKQRAPNIVAAFDIDPAVVNREISGCPCHHIRDLTRIVQEKEITMGIITVPAETAQHIADMMIVSGIRGILNFAPVPLKVPEYAFVDNVDIVSKLEKVAFFCH